MKSAIKEARYLLAILSLEANEQDLKRAYYRNAKYGRANGFAISRYLQVNEMTNPIPVQRIDEREAIILEAQNTRKKPIQRPY